MEARGRVAASGGLSAVLAALHALPGHNGVQTWGCNAMASLVWDTEAQAHASSGGALQVVVDAVKGARTDTVAKAACSALRSLCLSPPMRCAAAQLPAVPTLLELAADPPVPAVQTAYCFPLRACGVVRQAFDACARSAPLHWVARAGWPPPPLALWRGSCRR